jgi:Asp-tRNA(Asn)/Glu-tRNA(Gln) amidotransferase A subunit family amidase
MTNANELIYTSIAELAPRVARKEVSPVELAEATLARIENLNPRLNAYYTVFGDDLRVPRRRLGLIQQCDFLGVS